MRGCVTLFPHSDMLYNVSVYLICFTMFQFTWTFMQNTNSPEPDDEDPSHYEMEEDKLLEEEEAFLQPANGGNKELSVA